MNSPSRHSALRHEAQAPGEHAPCHPHWCNAPDGDGAPASCYSLRQCLPRWLRCRSSRSYPPSASPCAARARRCSRRPLGRARPRDLESLLLDLVPWDRRAAVDAWAPTHVKVPSGSRIAIDYSEPVAPVLVVRLQELFGLTDTPTVAGGRVALTLHLLPPARQPVQVTHDLAGFWRTTYFEVRKDLKGGTRSTSDPTTRYRRLPSDRPSGGAPGEPEPWAACWDTARNGLGLPVIMPGCSGRSPAGGT